MVSKAYHTGLATYLLYHCQAEVLPHGMVIAESRKE